MSLEHTTLHTQDGERKVIFIDDSDIEIEETLEYRERWLKTPLKDAAERAKRFTEFFGRLMHLAKLGKEGDFLNILKDSTPQRSVSKARSDRMKGVWARRRSETQDADLRK